MREICFQVPSTHEHVAGPSSFPSHMHLQRQAKAEIAAAHRRDKPIRHISVRRWGGRQFLTDVDAKADGSTSTSHALIAPRSGSLKIALPQEGAENCGAEKDGDDGDDVEGGKTMPRAGSRSRPIEEIRDSSSSIWLHFPHVELLFLLYAFEGAVGRQVSAIRDGDCPAVISLGLVYLVSREVESRVPSRQCTNCHAPVHLYLILLLAIPNRVHTCNTISPSIFTSKISVIHSTRVPQVLCQQGARTASSLTLPSDPSHCPNSITCFNFASTLR